MNDLLRQLKKRLSEEGLASVLARGISGAFVVKVASAGLGFVSQVILARVLNVEQYGIYTYVWTWVSVLGVLCTLGFKNVLTRFVASLSAEEQWADLRGLYREASSIVLLLSGSVAAAGALVVTFYLGPDRDLTAVYWAGFLALPLISLHYVRQGELRGLKHPVRAELPYHVLRPFGVAVVVAAVAFYGDSPTAQQAMLLTLAVLGGTITVATYWFYTRLSGPVWEQTVEAEDGRSWSRIAIPYLLISGAALIQNNTDIIMTGLIAGTAEAGLYKVTLRVSAVLGFFLNAANVIVGPVTSELHTKNEHDRLQRVIAWTAALSSVFAALGAVVLIGFGETVLGIFGTEFRSAYSALVILVIGQSAFALAGPVGMFATMTGQEWDASKAFALGAVVNIVLNALLIPPFGIEGAATATVTSTIVWNSFLAYLSWKRSGINTTAFAVLLRNRSF